MEKHNEDPSEKLLLSLLRPLAKLMIDNDVGLSQAVELLKTALVAEAYAHAPEASVSHVSLMTGVHRKDIKRLETADHLPGKASAAARVLTLWQNDPNYVQDGQPRVLSRHGTDGFDALVGLAKVDAAPATVLSVLLTSGNVVEEDDLIRFVSAAMVPSDRQERMRAAVATLVPHLDTAIGNLTGQPAQWDQALRYSHLTQNAADELEADATRMALDMLQTLNRKANALQQTAEGQTRFVAGIYVNKKVQD